MDGQSAISRSWADRICNLIERNPHRVVFLFTIMFPDQEPGGIGTPLENHPQDWLGFPAYYVPWSRTGRTLIKNGRKRTTPKIYQFCISPIFFRGLFTEFFWNHKLHKRACKNRTESCLYMGSRAPLCRICCRQIVDWHNWGPTTSYCL